MSSFAVDRLIFGPDDVDLARSPLAGQLGAETYVLGAFNPGLTRLASGNLLMMVRIAEALRTPIADGNVHAIRWDDGRYVLDAWPVVSSSVVLAVTVTCSATAPTLNWSISVAVSPMRNDTPSWRSSENPSSFASTTYVPTGRALA